MNTDSILNTIAKMILGSFDDSGVEQEQPFMTDLIIHINSVIAILAQRGVGPEEGFAVTGSTETWQDWLGDRKDLEMVKSLMYMRIRLMFDPPQNSFLVNSMEKLCDEYEWRAGIQADTSGEDNDDE